jgi:hypothetical protein
MKRPQVKLFNPYSILEVEIYYDIDRGWFGENKNKKNKLKKQAKEFLTQVVKDSIKQECEAEAYGFTKLEDLQLAEMIILQLRCEGYIRKYILDEDHLAMKLITVVW